MEDFKVRIDVKVPIQRIVDVLKTGARIWGGGVGARKCSFEIDATDAGYLLDFCNEDGTDSTVWIGDPYEVAWEMVKRASGYAVFTVEGQ